MPPRALWALLILLGNPAPVLAGTPTPTPSPALSGACAGVRPTPLPSPCICHVPTPIPVCGCNGHTYHNACETECAGVSIAYAGCCVCFGDCNADGHVTVGHLITLVNVALGEGDASACPAGIPRGGAVDIALIVEAVNNALHGCRKVQCGNATCLPDEVCENPFFSVCTPRSVACVQ
jgi:hypothetical protein